MDICDLTLAHRAQIDRFIKDEWGGPMIATRGNLYDSSALPGLMAVEGDELLGFLLYRMGASECEIAVLAALVQGRGAGVALLNRAVARAKDAGRHRIWLVTTNDNTPAIRFYQRYGFALKAVHIGAFEVTRRLKGELPTRGIDGIPIEHEFEFEILLG